VVFDFGRVRAMTIQRPDLFTEKELVQVKQYHHCFHSICPPKSMVDYWETRIMYSILASSVCYLSEPIDDDEDEVYAGHVIPLFDQEKFFDDLCVQIGIKMKDVKVKPPSSDESEQDDISEPPLPRLQAS
jgi:hypothetical protein